MDDLYVLNRGIRTRYRTMGERGPALVMIHGLGASLETWAYNIKPLSQDHRVFAPDVVWFGKSDKPAGIMPSLDYFARFVIGFMDSVGLPRATFVGSSLGGMIAVKTALDFPARVDSLVLASPAGFGRELGWLLRARAVLPPLRFLAPSRSAVRFAVTRLVYDSSIITEDFIQQIFELLAEPGALDSYRRVLSAGVDWRGIKPIALSEIRDRSHTLRVPTLVIWGKQDRILPVKHAEIASKRISGTELHLFDRCGHAPMIEKPDEFNSLVARFIRDRVAVTSAETPA